jgi:hypothetical protein
MPPENKQGLFRRGKGQAQVKMRRIHAYEDASAKAYFPAPSGSLFPWIATSNTERPIAETRIRAANARALRHAGGTKRGFEVSHRTQAQIRQGIGRTYPASPIKNIGSFLRSDFRRKRTDSFRYCCNQGIYTNHHSRPQVPRGLKPHSPLLLYAGLKACSTHCRFVPCQ